MNLNTSYIGANLGPLFHAGEMSRIRNGIFSKDQVDTLKMSTPPRLWKFCRFTGTMSNTMTLDTPGYNNPTFYQQIENNRNVNQPTQSYWYSFIDFYHKWGFEGVGITLNVHSSYFSLSNISEVVQKDIIEVIYLLIRNNVRILFLELGNEHYLYPEITGAAVGAVNVFAQRVQFGFSNQKIENFIYENCKLFASHLVYVRNAIKKAGISIPLGIPIANPDNMRDRAFNKAMLEIESNFDFLVPHIYVTDASDTGVLKSVTQYKDRIKSNLPLVCTEFNWNYIEKPNGHTRTSFALFTAFEKAFATNGINSYFWHCLWNRTDKNGWDNTIKL